MSKQLNLGCGVAKPKIAWPAFSTSATWDDDVTHVDILPTVGANKVFNAYDPTAWPKNWLNRFDEVHMYEFIEHIGQQGDYERWFAFWKRVWGACKPGAHVFVKSPNFPHRSAIEDPGHTRFIAEGTFWFLSKAVYAWNAKHNSPMTQYPIEFDFKTVACEVVGAEQQTILAILEAVK